MSYAEVAARGGPQDPEEIHMFPLLRPERVPGCAAPPVPEIVPSDSSVASLVDVDSGISVVSSDFPNQPVKTYTQAERLELEAAVEAEESAAREAAAKKKKGGKSESDLVVWLKDPVHSGGAIVSTVLVVGLGVVGWRKYRLGQFSWSTAGIGAGILAGVSLVEYFVGKFAQSYLTKRK
ncbi:hypothetical protein TWF225_003880 [Orbilia oligospora]|nr:hypothetical protein TWF225_003880 [Orbilia oligospora]KAF3248611.1 hypothetical protein TWF128_008327 [Orbilia oligospora]KAF3258654.1 hypothetical protein TWF217_005425 [Orbilia oligospora]